MIYALIGCLIIIGFLGFKLFLKLKIDKEVLDQYNLDIDTARTDLHELAMQLRTEIQRVAQYKTEYKQYKLRAEEYQDLINNKFADIDSQIEELRQKREKELELALADKQAYYNKLLEDTITQCNLLDETIKEASETKWREAMELIEKYNQSIEDAKERFESIERTLRLYEAEQQAKLFYTILLPEEYLEDIEFLLTTVAAKVQHPDIISKLVWTEYVKPNLDDTFKRIEAKSKPGIYKLTSLLNGKCYVGKSTDVKKRITDHFKSSVGLTTISDQEVHHIIRKEGFWNWMVEIIAYCEKDKLGELEKYYIDFFKSLTYGYNKRAGG